MSAKIVFLIVAAAAAGFFFVTRNGDISGGEARDLVANGATLVDVRTPDEFAAGHVPGAINIPVQELAARKGEIERSSPVVLYCRSGMRSKRAQSMLRDAGFVEVHNLGAMSRW